ncbi:LacI family DNA-binding transcriptional regulator [Pseudomonas sp. TH39(2020)]|uniref:substrate-binding domain-containing protein n=1 Tax=Pseudomonas sp. TH39(2020) TaxID=2796349 RepID=UPI001912EC88|nr:LacI family DNA-binding transcriptional regulator [Pseudomonas sp. TH39(2020)]
MQTDHLPKVSLIDVARHAGVSTATVSRVLNGTAIVSDARREAVERACDELGFVINGAARTLMTNRSMTIGAVVPNLAAETFSRPLAAFQRRVHEAGYTLLLADSQFDMDIELREVTTLLEHGVDALMVVGHTHHPKMWGRIESRGIPCVQGWTLDPNRPSVGFDNAAVAREMTSHLVEFGHRKIALIIGMRPSNDRWTTRIEAIHARLAEDGLELPDHYMIQDAFTLEDGRRAMFELLDLPEPPTGIICGNDILAFGAQIAAHSRGVRIPEDLSIIGLNDFHYAAYLTPPLTTMRINLEQIGERAGDYLLSQLTNEPLGTQPLIETKLMVRASTGPAPENR